MLTLEEAKLALHFLKSARSRIARQDYFICLTIRNVSKNFDHGYFGDIANKLTRAIEESLGGLFTIEDWLRKHNRPSTDSQAVRLNFLDRWIAQFERDIARKEAE